MNSRVGRLGGHSHDSRNLTFLFRSRQATTHRVYLNEVDTTLPGIFDYRFRVFETDLGKLNYWDRLIMTVHFHDPWSCQCEDCTSAVAEMEMRVGRPAV